jgi:hypothetical protein
MNADECRSSSVGHCCVLNNELLSHAQGTSCMGMIQRAHLLSSL